MKKRLGFVTNSSSASFILATNLSDEDFLKRILDLDMTLADKYVIKELMSSRDKLLLAKDMHSEMLNVMSVIIPLDVDADDYIEMRWMDEGTSNVRYKHIYAYRVEQGKPEWVPLHNLIEKVNKDNEIFVWHMRD